MSIYKIHQMLPLYVFSITFYIHKIQHPSSNINKILQTLLFFKIFSKSYEYLSFHILFSSFYYYIFKNSSTPAATGACFRDAGGKKITSFSTYGECSGSSRFWVIQEENSHWIKPFAQQEEIKDSEFIVQISLRALHYTFFTYKYLLPKQISSNSIKQNKILLHDYLYKFQITENFVHQSFCRYYEGS